MHFLLLYIFDIFVVFSDIYHEILRIVFLHKSAKDCFFLCQETCVYAIITASICFENLIRICLKTTGTFENISTYAKNNFSF